MITLEQLFRRDYGSAKIGVFGCGCQFYWHQFKGLRDRLVEHQRYFEERLEQHGVSVMSGGGVNPRESTTISNCSSLSSPLSKP